MQWFRVHLRAGRLLVERGRREVVFLLAGDGARLRARLGGAGLGVSGACDRLAVRYPETIAETAASGAPALPA